MRLRLRAALILAAGLVSCRRPAELTAGRLGLPDTATLQGVDLSGAGGRLVVSVSADGEVQWFWSHGRTLRQLLPPPVTLIPEACAPSPDGRYLAVISRGEGHPMLDLLSLPRVLDGTHGSRPLRTIDPYPGFIELAGWRDGRLGLRSDRPLLTCCDENGRIPGDLLLEPAGTYWLDPSTGAIEAERP